MSPTCSARHPATSDGTALRQRHLRNPRCPKVRGTSTGVSTTDTLSYLTRLCKCSHLVRDSNHMLTSCSDLETQFQAPTHAGSAEGSNINFPFDSSENNQNASIFSPGQHDERIDLAPDAAQYPTVPGPSYTSDTGTLFKTATNSPSTSMGMPRNAHAQQYESYSYALSSCLALELAQSSTASESAADSIGPYAGQSHDFGFNMALGSLGDSSEVSNFCVTDLESNALGDFC